MHCVETKQPRSADNRSSDNSGNGKVNKNCLSIQAVVLKTTIAKLKDENQQIESERDKMMLIANCQNAKDFSKHKILVLAVKSLQLTFPFEDPSLLAK